MGRDDHDYRECTDHHCERFPCVVYKEGFRDGYEQGFGDGYANGYAEGFADGAAPAGE